MSTKPIFSTYFFGLKGRSKALENNNSRDLFLQLFRAKGTKVIKNLVRLETFSYLPGGGLQGVLKERKKPRSYLRHGGSKRMACNTRNFGVLQ